MIQDYVMYALRAWITSELKTLYSRKKWYWSQTIQCLEPGTSLKPRQFSRATMGWGVTDAMTSEARSFLWQVPPRKNEEKWKVQHKAMITSRGSVDQMTLTSNCVKVSFDAGDHEARLCLPKPVLHWRNTSDAQYISFSRKTCLSAVTRPQSSHQTIRKKGIGEIPKVACRLKRKAHTNTHPPFFSAGMCAV